jgi:hypothetical protein
MPSSQILLFLQRIKAGKDCAAVDKRGYMHFFKLTSVGDLTPRVFHLAHSQLANQDLSHLL